MVAKKKASAKKKKRSASLGVAFWLLFFLVMAALFLINYPRIQKTWENVVGRNKHTEQNTDTEPELTPEAIVEAGQQVPPFETVDNPPFEIVEAVEGVPDAEPTPTPTPTILTPAQKPDTSRETSTKPVAPETRQELRQRTLFFVNVDATGMVFIKSVNRMITTKGSPLIESLNALLLGPDGMEKKQGLTTLIPEGSRILSARVDGSTAFLNFNETFIFNSYGAEGYIAQLRQIVWTASEFPSVQDVQILVEGKKIDFLGETIRIDRPINRNTL
jgi:spore germination protein GerM